MGTVSRTTIKKGCHARTYPVCVPTTFRHIVSFIWPTGWERTEEGRADSPSGRENSITIVPLAAWSLDELTKQLLGGTANSKTWINAQHSCKERLPTKGPKMELPGIHDVTQTYQTHSPTNTFQKAAPKWKRSHKHNSFPLLPDPYLHPDSIITSVRMLRKYWENWTLLTPHSSYTSQQSETR